MNSRTPTAPSLERRIEGRIDDESAAEAIKSAFIAYLFFGLGQELHDATPHNRYVALAHVVRDRLMRAWIDTARRYPKAEERVVAYLSAEFLLGPHLANNLANLRLFSAAERALADLGIVLADLIAEEPEPGLGNGGLGRLAACYMDSLSTLGVPAIGYGIRYEFGMFRQAIVDGRQVELTDKWLQYGNPWDILSPDISTDVAFEVKFGGRTQIDRDQNGRPTVRWIPEHIVRGVPYDTPICGYDGKTVNLLRLWKAEAVESFDFSRFETGDYLGAVSEKVMSETISKVIYPSDENLAGKQLRLGQQYFFVACSLSDMIRLHLERGRTIGTFNEKFAVQLNDTHPSIAVAELMRLLIDEHGIDWETAWNVTVGTFGYTNHTLLPEALERWPLPLFAAVLPRHLEIIYEINARFLAEVRAAYPGDEARVARMSIIDGSGERYVRMAHLATVGSHAINGVAALHTHLLETDTLHDFFEMYPQRFSNKTNGVTPRRWLLVSNPRLAKAISAAIGKSWITNLNDLVRLEAFVDDADFLRSWRNAKVGAKADLAAHVFEQTGVQADPRSMFDVQVKRLHEYKRQHLSVLHILALYYRIKREPQADITPRTFIFGGKAAPSYTMAKLIIQLINAVAAVVNADPDVRRRIQIVFLPNFNVALGQRVYPAADLSEQISTAGKEASGTGCMKFGLNGALTIGTLDGANIEMRDAVGADNFFSFGLTADEVNALQRRGYDPRVPYDRDSSLREVIDGLAGGAFSAGDTSLFRPLIDSLLGTDPYMVLADFSAYVACQERAARTYEDQRLWTRMSILNCARMGRFSSDRAVREYCRDIWHVDAAQLTSSG